MKTIKSILLLLLFAGISIIGEKIINNSQKLIVEKTSFENPHKTPRVRTNYIINVDYAEFDNSLNVKEEIKWENIDSANVDTIYLNIPKNLSKTNGDNSAMNYEINSFKINGNDSQFEFENNDAKNFVDSTLVKTIIPNGEAFNESLLFEISYKIIIPIGSRFSDSYFYNFENWYVTISPYFNGKFYNYPSHKFIEPFLEYSNFEVNINTPIGVSIATSGKIEEEIVDGTTIFHCSASGIKRFNWFAFNDLSKFARKKTINGNEINITLFIQESKDGYVDRYFDTVEKYIISLSELDLLPFDDLTIIDLPNITDLGNKSYSNLIALRSDLISPVKTQKLEYELASQITNEYLGNILNSNYLEESWLPKGISAYLAEKLVRTHFGDLHSYFNIADYYPVSGLHFLSYAGIPLIYTISNQIIPEGARHLDEYYKNISYSDLSIPTYQLPNYTAYKVSSIMKPEISLLTLEKIIGEEKFKRNLQNYLKANVHEFSTGNEFLKVISSGGSSETIEFCNELFASDKLFDYAINYIEKRDDNKYDIMVERIESGVTPIKLSIYREFDTLQINWDGKDKFKIFTISSDQEIISAEIDSEMKNMLDLNFANNSYIIEDQYWGSISYATRIFFWFQNALMLIGGKG
ncbi:MAG: hypothetical protein KKF62_03165 [Bacteroidetes bacterium]|nr:hypothetical protein [Bacteroidota bacterium]MBU1115049.1 hypothetical protein [Bacteroidota bacterium]MBU1799541.1 hypothetical protein [Bacteroidota bacterium]